MIGVTMILERKLRQEIKILKGEIPYLSKDVIKYSGKSKMFSHAFHISSTG